MKNIKLINDNLKTTNNKVYLCIWNDGEITEIHTKKTLLSNYYDIKKEYKNNSELAWSGLTWKKIFETLDNLNLHHYEDNMYIKRIK